MNMVTFEGKSVAAHQIIETAQVLPFMGEKRLVIVEDSGLFISGRKSDAELINTFIENIPPTTCLIFLENEVDKRNKLYKTMNSMKVAIEFKTLKEEELLIWIKREFKKDKRAIDNKTALYMIRTVGTSMGEILNEIEKLIAYTDENADITSKDIDNICTKSLEAHIFDLLKAMGYKKADEALRIYSNLILLKEPPIRILAMITRQIRLILQVKYLYERGTSPRNIAQELKQPYFVVNDCLKQSQFFTISTLKQAIKDCLETDIASKTGKMEPQLAIEIFLMKYSK